MVAGHAVVSASISAVLSAALQEVVTDASESPDEVSKWSRAIRRGLVKGRDAVMQATYFCLETAEQLWQWHALQRSVRGSNHLGSPAALTDTEELPLWLRLVQDPSHPMSHN
jgi:hypothetical protein